MNSQVLVRYAGISILAALLFIPFLGNVHLFDWDEINFAECAREMIVSKDYLMVQIDFQPFWEKPPFFIWLQVLSMKLFGVNEFAARFPNAMVGIVTLLTIFYAGKRVLNERLATWWTVLYAISWLPHFYFKSGIIDPTFNYFIFLAFFQLHLLRFGKNKMLHAALAGLSLGVAILTKGPVAALIFGLCGVVYLVINKGIWGYRFRYLFLIFITAFIPFGIWFCAAILTHGWEYGSWFMQEFITYQIRLFQTEDADHGGPFFYHFLVLLIGCFPAAPFLFLFGRNRSTDTEQPRDFTRWMWILFIVTLLLFSIVKTKIVHYSSLCYFPLTFLAALKIYQLDAREIKFKKGVLFLFLFIGSLLGLVIALLPVVGLHKAQLIPLIDDPFAVGNLQAAVKWHYAEMVWGILYLIGIWIAAFLMKRHFRRGMLVLAATQIIIMQITILHFTPKIEAYSQRVAIRYFKSFVGKDVYVQVLGYKSFAQLFYTEKTPQTVLPKGKDEAWLLAGAIDKPAYFICKITSAENYRNMPTLQEIGERNGFVFFKRR